MNEQIVKEVPIKDQADHDKWISKFWEPIEYEQEVCCLISAQEVREIIDSHKKERAPGVEGILTGMLKNANSNYINKFNNLINKMFVEGDVPATLQTRMPLFDKKKPSLDMKKKPPLTVSSLHGVKPSQKSSIRG